MITTIKKELRANMNGIASQAMGRSSDDYRINFGVELPRIHSIAAEFDPNHDLAQQLWKESVRECRILAGILQPVETFLPEIADIWVDGIHTLELAQMTTINLFRRLPYASEKAFGWIASGRELTQQCGYLTLCHLMRDGKLNERAVIEFVDQACASYGAGSPMLRKTIVRALAIFAETNEENARRQYATNETFRKIMPLLFALPIEK